MQGFFGKHPSNEFYPNPPRCALSNKILDNPVVDLETGISYDSETFKKKFPRKRHIENLALRNIVSNWEKISRSKQEDPCELLCPITCQPFEDPVMLCESAQTYERKSIEDWLKKNSKDPLTQKELHKPTQMVSNHTLKKAMEQLNAPFPIDLSTNKEEMHEIHQAANLNVNTQNTLEACMEALHQASSELDNMARVSNLSERISDKKLYSSNVENLFRPKKGLLEGKFKEGLIKIINSQNEDALESLIKLLDIIKKSNTVRQLKANMARRNDKAFSESFGMTSDEILQFLLPRLLLVKRSKTHIELTEAWISVTGEEVMRRVEAFLQDRGVVAHIKINPDMLKRI